MSAGLWLRIDDPIDGEQLVWLVEESVVGRDFRCDVVIHDDEASRMHGRITPHADQWQLTDLATTNGTYVNGERIVGPADIVLGDTIRIGRVACTVVAPPI